MQTDYPSGLIRRMEESLANGLPMPLKLLGGGAKVVCLVPARTDTTWWHDTIIQHDVRFLRGRLKFGNSKNSAPFPSALVVMG